MASERNYTELLPNEVLCMVFDRLDEMSVKNASRTCKRWNNIIFHSEYVQRFQVNISAFSYAALKINVTKSLLPKAQELAHTDRRYRNFWFVIMEGMEQDAEPIWKILHPKHTSNMYALYLNYINASMMTLFLTVIDAIPSMTQLRSLGALDVITVRHKNYQDIRQENIPLIRSRSIQELTMYCKYKYTIDMPELKVFKGALSGLILPDGGDGESLVLAKLQHLSVTVESWQSVGQSFFRRIPNVVKIEWDIPVTDGIFLAMCNALPSLIEARFSKELVLSRRHLLDELSRLTQLRRLSFYLINMQHDVFLDLSKLTLLEELDLGFTHLMPITLLSLSKTIKKFGVHITGDNKQSLMEIIARNLTQLTELRLACYPAPLSTSVLNALPSLEQLEVLVFSHGQFTQSFFLEMKAPMRRLHTLRFQHCQLESKQLLGLQDKFPNLKNPEFVECKLISDESKGGSGQTQGIQEIMAAFADRLKAAFQS
ncbi:hypothetical protein AND_010167 [Anopheles darlingi]|uniref:F-box domain-containing protein n=1 Tax=Anopheles darlingi TaxID=43151 RepID=W5J5V6_ANODA|nr:hypothetical protein AND_010167 [Anopheles darlingi]